MLKLYVFWGAFVAVLIGVVVTLVKRRQRGRRWRNPPPVPMQFHMRSEADGKALASRDRNEADAPVTGTPRLMCLGGSNRGHCFAIPPGGLTIGRANDNDLIIVDGRIAAHHAWIGIVGSRAMLRDYQSLNGTFLNADMNTPVSDVDLADGDTIHFGGEGGEEFRLVVE